MVPSSCHGALKMTFQYLDPAAIRRLLEEGLFLGEGSSSRAFRVSTGDKAMCVKTFRNGGLEDLKKEVEALTALSGVPRVPVIFGVGREPVTLVTDFGGSTLQREIHDISRSQAIDIGLQVALTLRAMHARGWAHNDLKPNNIVVQRVGSVCRATVVDFGNAAVFGTCPYGRIPFGHQWYPHLAPELLLGGKASSKSDVYSLGFVLKTLISPPGYDLDDGDVSLLVSQVMVRNPEERLPIDSVVKILSDIHFEIFTEIIMDSFLY